MILAVNESGFWTKARAPSPADPLHFSSLPSMHWWIIRCFCRYGAISDQNPRDRRGSPMPCQIAPGGSLEDTMLQLKQNRLNWRRMAGRLWTSPQLNPTDLYTVRHRSISIWSICCCIPTLWPVTFHAPLGVYMGGSGPGNFPAWIPSYCLRHGLQWCHLAIRNAKSYFPAVNRIKEGNQIRTPALDLVNWRQS